MSGINSTVNQRTNMAGQNRLELLLFGLNDNQVYGINVFKVREVLTCPELTSIPKQTTALKGLAHIRGETIPVIDLSQAIGGTPVNAEDRLNCFLIVSEYNRRVLAFLVRNVDRILPAKWDQVSPPPIETNEKNYLTAVVQYQDGLIEILDVEQILADLIPVSTEVKTTVISESVKKNAAGYRILVVDDSSVARTQVRKALENLNIKVTMANDGKEALDMLTQLADKGEKATDKFLMVISDIEMPQMDGYTLVKRIREDIRLKSLYVMLHSSLSGRFNVAMVKRVGADVFIGKFNPDELAEAVIKRIESVEG